MENSFWIGFEKRAKKKSTLENIDEITANTKPNFLAATLAAIASNTIALGGSRLLKSPKMLEEDAKKLSDDLIKSMSNKKDLNNPPHVSIFKDGDFHSPSHYNPLTHSVASSPNAETIAHELGHATGPMSDLSDVIDNGNIKKNLNKKQLAKLIYTMSQIPGRHPVGMLLGLGGSAALTATGRQYDNETLQNIAPTIPTILAAPTLFEEGQASVRGLKHLAKVRGLKTALRGAPSLLSAFGTYAALPVAGGGAIYLTNKYSLNNNKRNKGK